MNRIIITIDDGCESDVRIAGMLESYKLRGLFYINSGLVREKRRIEHPRGGSLLLVDELLKIAKSHEIGGHTLTHPYCIRDLPERMQNYEIETDRQRLMVLTGQKVESFCYPRGKYSQDTIEIVKKSGYKWARTVDIGFGYMDDNPFRTKCFHLAQRREYGNRHWIDVVKDAVKESISNNKDLVLFMHGWELNANNDWDSLDNLLKFIHDNSSDSTDLLGRKN